VTAAQWAEVFEAGHRAAAAAPLAPVPAALLAMHVKAAEIARGGAR
jgi:hypothetical protein